jgi:ABC-2 type transport system ATP-binding protein
MSHALSISGLTKTYANGVQALRGVELNVREGDFFALLGPNGAGKSTLVKTLLSVVGPTAGAATLMGIDISRAQARRGVGYLPENHRFPRYLTGRGVCEYFGKLTGLHGPALRREVDEKLALVGMQEWSDTKVAKYSKGMAQRIGLAQALVGNPKLVFLDEPTDGVDPVGRHQLRELIKSLRQSGTTVFLNSHLLLEVEQVCDHVAIMHKGRVLEQGSLEEIRSTVTRSRGTLNVRFATGPLDDAAAAAVREIGPFEEVSGGIQIALESETQISDVIDRLRARGVAIYAVEPTRVNLEEAFLDVINQQEDQAVGAVRE